MNKTRSNHYKRNEINGSCRSLPHCFSFQQLETCIFLSNGKEQAEEPVRVVATKYRHQPHHQKQRVLLSD
ncbi:hypothetical protein ACEQPO_06370 [Bacillus sp. SL00103]